MTCLSQLGADYFRGNSSATFFVLALVVLFIGALIYWPVMDLQYVWDDNILFVDNSELRQGPITWSTLSKPVLIGTAYFRPFVIWTFMAEFRYLGLSAAISHSINYAIYLANVSLVLGLAWCCLRRLGYAQAALRAAIVGLLYALHPALIESTAWVSGRFDLLATFFVLVALLSDLVIARPWLRASVIAIAFALGLGSKEVAVALPLLLVLQRLAVEPPQQRFAPQVWALLQSNSRTVFTCAVIAVAYVLLRLDAVSDLLPKTTGPDGSLRGWSKQTAFTLQAVFFYVEQSLMPFMGTSMPAHPVDLAKVLSPKGVGEVAAVLLMLGVLVLGLIRRAPWAMLLASALFCLLPVLHIIPLPISNNIGSDRFLTLPLVFIALAAGLIRFKVAAIRPAVAQLVTALVVGTWAVAAAANVRATIPLWADNLTLWGWIYRAGIDSPNARINFTSAALREGRYDLAKPVFDERLKAGPLESNEQAYYGFMLVKTGDVEEGTRYIEGALYSYPPIKPPLPGDVRRPSIRESYLRDRIAFGHYAMAEARIMQFDAVAALESIEKARAFDPTAPYIKLSHSLVLKVLGRDQEADALYQEVISAAHPRIRAGYEKRRKTFLQRWATHQPADAMPAKEP